MLSIGVDIGGTKIAAGVVDESGEIIATTTRSTPATDAALIEAAVADAVAELRSDHSVVGVGVGAAGFVGADRRTVTSRRTSRGGSTRSPRSSSASPGCRSWSRTTRTPPVGPSTASVRPPGPRTCSW